MESPPQVSPDRADRVGMLATVPDPMLDGIVPSTRLGAVLARRRRQRGETITAVSRRCPPAWTPDRLTALERGQGTPPDDVADVVGAYGLEEGRWTPASELRLVLDRSDDATTSAAATAPHREPHWQLMRLAAVGVALGLDGRWTGGRSRLLGDAFDLAPREVARQLAEALESGHDLVTGWVERTRAMTAVVPAGVLLARGVGGSLVLTAPPRVPSARTVPAITTIAELITRTAAVPG